MLYIILCLILIVFEGTVFAETNDFYLMPQAEDTADYLRAIERISSSGGHVWDQYDIEAYRMGGSQDNKHNLGNQIASGVMNRNTVIDYFVYVVRFMSQMALLIGACMIIYAGYTYGMASFRNETGSGSRAIKNAVIGILIVIFAYAIIRILTIAFIE